MSGTSSLNALFCVMRDFGRITRGRGGVMLVTFYLFSLFFYFYFLFILCKRRTHTSSVYSTEETVRLVLRASA